MKKNIILAVAAMFVLGIFMGEMAYAKEYKMAYVDLAKLFDEYKKTKDSEKTLTDKGKTKESERKKMVDDIKKLKDEMALLSEKAKAEKQKIYDDKIIALQNFDRNTRDDLIKERNDLLGGIMKDIEKVIADYAKEKGYDLILNSRLVLYGVDEGDVTGDVLTRLNR